MTWKYQWAVLLLPLLAACVNSTTATPTVAVTAVVSPAITPIATGASLPMNGSPSVPATPTSAVTPTVSRNPTPTPRVVDPLIQDFILELNDQGVPTRLMGRMFASDNCMIEYDSVLHGSNSGKGIEFGFGNRFDLYPFESEQLATEVASKIPPDAECRGGSRMMDSVYESPYFQCGALIAFIQIPDTRLQSTFEELCGPPFAQTVVRFPAIN